MNKVWVARVSAGLLLSASVACGAADYMSGCGRLEAGTGDHPEQPHAVPYTALAARSLRVDLEHDVSMIVFPALLDPSYAIALRPGGNGKWTLYYAVDKGAVQRSRAFHATVSLSATLADRVVTAWKHAVAEASHDDPLACISVDGTSYVFSAGGRQAHIWEPTGGVPAQLIAISDTLKVIALDTKNTGNTTHSSQAQLVRLLERLESELKSGSQKLIGSNQP